MKDTALYLSDALAHLDLIESFVSGGRAEFLSDPKTQFAVIRAYEWEFVWNAVEDLSNLRASILKLLESF